MVVDLVYFTLGHLRRPGVVQVPRGTEESRGKEVASGDHLDGVKRNVLVVAELVEILGGEQRYLARKLVGGVLLVFLAGGRDRRREAALCVGFGSSALRRSWGGLPLSCPLRRGGSSTHAAARPRSHPQLPPTTHANKTMTKQPKQNTKTTTKTKTKQERHMRTARSSNRRAFWYTALEVAVALAVGAAQVGVVRGWFKGGPARITV